MFNFAKKEGRSIAYNFLQAINWSKTYAYSASNTEQGIYINLKEREHGGVIQPGAEYEKMRDKIIEDLKALHDPVTGEAILSHIYKREDVYHGQALDNAPDLIFFFKGGEYLADVQVKGAVFEDANWNSGWGTHRMDGILLGYGKDIKKNVKLNEAHIMDMAPTILRLMGIPIPKDMDGKVLESIFDDDFLKTQKKTYSDDEGIVSDPEADHILSDDNEDEVVKHLKGLGYL